MVYKQPEWHATVQACWTARKLAEQTACGPNSIKAGRMTYRSNVVLQVTPTLDTLILKTIRADIGWVWLMRLTSKAKTNMQTERKKHQKELTSLVFRLSFVASFHRHT